VSCSVVVPFSVYSYVFFKILHVSNYWAQTRHQTYNRFSKLVSSLSSLMILGPGLCVRSDTPSWSWYPVHVCGVILRHDHAIRFIRAVWFSVMILVPGLCLISDTPSWSCVPGLCILRHDHGTPCMSAEWYSVMIMVPGLCARSDTPSWSCYPAYTCGVIIRHDLGTRFMLD
jgi:hypothetical protein